MIRKYTLLLVIVLSGLTINSQNLDDLDFGTDSTLEVVTWNIERFPLYGQMTVDYVVEIIEAMDVDLIGLQEIDSKSRFEQLVDELEDWDGFYVDAEYSGLAYIYKPSVIEFVDTFQIYKNLNREFPRPPFIFKFKYNDQPFVVFNNHFKCCGDGDLDSGDAWDEETRRFHACNLLEGYINSNYSEDNVILLGDLNDILIDNAQNNVFEAFTDEADKYVFTDMDIAEGSISDWSYPGWPSHLDHILVSNELFTALENDGSEIRTIKVDQYLEGGFEEYEDIVSDHRPVALRLNMDSDVVRVNDLDAENLGLIAYPNPFKQSTTITFNASLDNTVIEVYSSNGECVYKSSVGVGHTNSIWKATGLPIGVYYITLIIDGKLKAIFKSVLSD